MRTEYTPNPTLPSLAWLARFDVAAARIRIEHGKYVETHPRFFFEGAWDGKFTQGRPDETEVVFGSGAVVSVSAVCFVPSLATTDYIFYRCDQGIVIAANSLALLLAATSDELDPAFRHYADINNSIMHGVCTYERTIPTRRGTVARLMHHNLSVTVDGVTEVPKPDPPHFPTYQSYRDYVANSYAALAQNARDAGRRNPLRIYSTQSRGYDTTAINAIAAPHGLDGVFTVRTGKAGGAFADEANEHELNDDGTEIAQALGIALVIQLERRAFRDDFSDELYYHASIHESQDANLKQVVAHIVAPALLLTGTLGELWSTMAAWHFEPSLARGVDLQRMDLGGHGLLEVRLRAGYVQVALPYIGARRRAEILAISESSEMRPWRLGTDYDRPIPRRLGESAGVPRTSFGQVKMGSVVQFTPPQVPQSANLRAAYFDFLVTEGLRRRWQLRLFPLIHRANAILWFATHDRYPLAHYAMRAASKLLRREVRPPTIWCDLRGSLHCYAVNTCAAEYQRGLTGSDNDRCPKGTKKRDECSQSQTVLSR